MSINLYNSCDYKLNNLKFTIGQKYHIMKLTYGKKFNNIRKLIDEKIGISVHHKYILIECVNKQGNKCLISLGLSMDPKTRKSLINIPDIQLTKCKDLYNNREDDMFKFNYCDPVENINNEEKIFYGKKIYSGKLNYEQIMILQLFINNTVKKNIKKYKNINVFNLPFYFSLLPKVGNLFKNKCTKYYHCIDFCNYFHEKPKYLLNDIIKYSDNLTIKKTIDFNSGRIHKITGKKGAKLFKEYNKFVNENYKKKSRKKSSKRYSSKRKSYKKNKKIFIY
jgi:hypothetical protein